MRKKLILFILVILTLFFISPIKTALAQITDSSRLGITQKGFFRITSNCGQDNHQFVRIDLNKTIPKGTKVKIFRNGSSIFTSDFPFANGKTGDILLSDAFDKSGIYTYVFKQPNSILFGFIDSELDRGNVTAIDCEALAKINSSQLKTTQSPSSEVEPVGDLSLNEPEAMSCEGGTIGVALSWTPAENATNYIVYRITQEDENLGYDPAIVTRTTLDTTEVTDRVASGVAYRYSVQAFNKDNLSGYKMSDNNVAKNFSSKPCTTTPSTKLQLELIKTAYNYEDAVRTDAKPGERIGLSLRIKNTGGQAIPTLRLAVADPQVTSQTLKVPFTLIADDGQKEEGQFDMPITGNTKDITLDTVRFNRQDATAAFSEGGLSIGSIGVNQEANVILSGKVNDTIEGYFSKNTIPDACKVYTDKNQCKERIIRACFVQDGRNIRNESEVKFSNEEKNAIKDCIDKEEGVAAADTSSSPAVVVRPEVVPNAEPFTLHYDEQCQNDGTLIANLAWSQSENATRYNVYIKRPGDREFGFSHEAPFEERQAPVALGLSRFATPFSFYIAALNKADEVTRSNVASFVPEACKAIDIPDGPINTTTEEMTIAGDGVMLTPLVPAVDPGIPPYVEIAINGRESNAGQLFFLPNTKVDIGVRVFRNQQEWNFQLTDGCGIYKKFNIAVDGNKIGEIGTCEGPNRDPNKGPVETEKRFTLPSANGNHTLTVEATDDSSYNQSFFFTIAERGVGIITETLAHVNGKDGVPNPETGDLIFSTNELSQIEIGGRVYTGSDVSACLETNISLSVMPFGTEKPIYKNENVINCQTDALFNGVRSSLKAGKYVLLAKFTPPARSLHLGSSSKTEFEIKASADKKTQVRAVVAPTTINRRSVPQLRSPVRSSQIIKGPSLAKLLKKRIAGVSVDEGGTITYDPSAGQGSFPVSVEIIDEEGNHVDGFVEGSLLVYNEDGSAHYITPDSLRGVPSGSVINLSESDLGDLTKAKRYILSFNYAPDVDDPFAASSTNVDLPVDDVTKQTVPQTDGAVPTPTPFGETPTPIVPPGNEITLSPLSSNVGDGSGITSFHIYANRYTEGRFEITENGEFLEEVSVFPGGNCSPSDYVSCGYTYTHYGLNGNYTVKFCIEDTCSNDITFSTRPLPEEPVAPEEPTATPEEPQEKVIYAIDWLDGVGGSTSIPVSPGGYFDFNFPEGTRGDISIGLLIHYTDGSSEAVTLVLEDGLPGEEPTAEPEVPTTAPEEEPTATPGQPSQESCYDDAQDLGDGTAQPVRVCPGQEPEPNGDRYCINGNPDTNNCNGCNDTVYPDDSNLEQYPSACVHQIPTGEYPNCNYVWEDAPGQC